MSAEGGRVLPRWVSAVDDQFAVMESRGEKVLRTSGMISARRRLFVLVVSGGAAAKETLEDRNLRCENGIGIFFC